MSTSRHDRTTDDIRRDLEALAEATGPFCFDVDLDEFADRLSPVYFEAKATDDVSLHRLAEEIERKLERAFNRRDEYGASSIYHKPPQDRHRGHSPVT